MFRLTAEGMGRATAFLRAQHELPRILEALRRYGGPATDRIGDEQLRAELERTLARCDALGLDSDEDRMALCLLDASLFPGLRDLPELPALLEHADGPAGARMTALYLAAPPRFWAWLAERAPQVRQERGWT
ncbi:MAG: hypothetical protein ACK5TK_06650 [Betaproteobacteria bacterium]